MMGHAWGTEMLQEALHDYCFRGGSLSDIGFDVIGIIVGVGLSWPWWTQEDKEKGRQGDRETRRQGDKKKFEA
jgi:hypothetical protein